MLAAAATKAGVWQGHTLLWLALQAQPACPVRAQLSGEACSVLLWLLLSPTCSGCLMKKGVASLADKSAATPDAGPASRGSQRPVVASLKTVASSVTQLTRIRSPEANNNTEKHRDKKAAGHPGTVSVDCYCYLAITTSSYLSVGCLSA